MAIKISKMDVWVGEIEDKAGGLAEVLDPVAKTGANFEFIIARRQQERMGSGVLFVTPIKGKRAQDAARSAGLYQAERISTLKVEGDDRPGVTSEISKAIGNAGVSMRGLSGAAIGRKFVHFIGFDSGADADKAAKAIKAAIAKKK